MISIRIDHSSDPLAIGTFIFQFNRLSIGSREDSLFRIRDKSLNPIHINIEVNNKNILTVHNMNQSFFSINGKKSNGKYPIQKDDEISFGDNKITIQDFSFDQNDLSRDPIAEVLENFPERKDILLKLEQTLLEIEYEINR